MNGVVSWIFEVTINDGQRDNFKALMTEVVDATKGNEPGTLAYEWFIVKMENSVIFMNGIRIR